MKGLAWRIALLALLVMAVAVAVIAVGVLLVAQSSFSRLMAQAGEPADVARSMFDDSVVAVFTAATLVAALAGVVLAVLLAIRLARPLREIAAAAGRLAQGEHDVRVNRSGPEEIRSLADSFNRMAGALQEQERIRREFIINASHELTTPLTNLQGYLEAIRDGVIPASPEQLQSLQEEVERLVRLSQSLQTLAADEPPRGKAAANAIDLGGAIRSAVDLARPVLETKAIDLTVQVPGALHARIHPDQIAQVLANLLQNACRYTPGGGAVSVTAEALPKTALVCVSNSGEGIPQADLPHIFERFYRVEKSRDRAYGGAGIGLAIVKQLVEANGGRVGAESGQGMTRIWFSLPV